ncbi:MULTISPECIES: hypothetical protein [unclassified Xanthobacter]|uniref:hypothetical protein n=1 Tax=unclassified Xanthobacter TaxID=2623496 RepID=UPI001EDEFA09|nr:MULTISPECIES: hypothetical protein [unclassified Xanthobacter]
MTKQNQRDIRAMRMPHRRDISARQDLLGRELRQLFDDYAQESVPDELESLARRLQTALTDHPKDEARHDEAPQDEMTKRGTPQEETAPTPAGTTPPTEGRDET